MIAWLGTIAGILGSLTLAVGFAIPAYCVMFVGAVCCIIDAFKRDNKAMIVQFSFFAVINIIGLFHYAN